MCWLDSFCCCCSIRTGVLGATLFSLVHGGVELLLAMYTILNHHVKPKGGKHPLVDESDFVCDIAQEPKVLYWATTVVAYFFIVMSSVHILTSVLLIASHIKDKNIGLRFWMVTTALFVMGSIACSLFLANQQECCLKSVLSLMLDFYSLYTWIVVQSFYRDLKEAEGYDHPRPSPISKS